MPEIRTFDDQFDWNPLGRTWWATAAQECNATPLQARFAVGKTRGRGHSAAAREAGVASAYKSVGFELSKHPKVIALVTMAATARKTRPRHLEDAKPTGEMTPAEAKEILTGIARAADPVLKIRAVEALAKIVDQEEQRDRRELSLDQAYDAAQKAAGAYGAQFLTEAFFAEHKSLPWNCEAFAAVATKLAAAFPERWQHYRAALPGHQLKFSEAGIA